MRAFDLLYDKWELEGIDTNKEKEENRVVVRETIEKLIYIFNFLSETEFIDAETDMDLLNDRILQETSIDPLTLFSDHNDFKKLIDKIFYGVFTLNRFEEFLQNDRPDNIVMFAREQVNMNWRQLLDHGITLTKYKIGHQQIEVIPRAGLSLDEVASWPFNYFFDPGDPFSRRKRLDSDIVAIKRKEPFAVKVGDWQYEKKGYAFYYDNIPGGYVWVGSNNIGVSLSTGEIKLLPKIGHQFLASLKYDPKITGINVLLSYLDFCNPEVKFAKLQVLINDEHELWSDITDAGGKKISEIYDFWPLDPTYEGDSLSLQLVCNDEALGDPTILFLDNHLLFSEYSRSVLQPGKRKFGERSYTLFTRAHLSFLTHSQNVKVRESTHQPFGRYNVYHISWEDHNEPFHLTVEEVEWSFYVPEEIFIRSEFQFHDEIFQISGELIPFVVQDTSEIRFSLETNFDLEQLNLYDINLSFEERCLSRRRLGEALRPVRTKADRVYQLDESFFLELSGLEQLKIGKYTISLTRGRSTSRDHYRQDLDFFVLPRLNVSPECQVVMEGDDVRVIVQADQSCFFDESSEELVSERLVSFGSAHLERDFSLPISVLLKRPNISVMFSHQPNIFACRLGSHELSSEVNLQTLKENSLIVYGMPSSEITVGTNSTKKQYTLNPSGQIEIPFSFIQKSINDWKTPFFIRHKELERQFQILWQTDIRRFAYSKIPDKANIIHMDEAWFELEIEGPPDSSVQLRLSNNLGQICGERVITETGVIEGSVLWSNPVMHTPTLVLKALVRNAKGLYVDSGVNELLYEFISPELELRSYQNQIEKDKFDSVALYKAAMLGYKHRLLGSDEIRSLFIRSYEAGLSDVPRLEEAAKALSDLGYYDKARQILRRAIQAFGASLDALVDYMKYVIAQPTWSENEDTTLRQIIDKAEEGGLTEGRSCFFSGCRALKAGRVEEAREFFYRCRQYPDISEYEVQPLLALTYYKKGLFNEILRIFQEKSQATETSTSLLLRGWAQYIAHGNIDESNISFDETKCMALQFLSEEEKNVLKAIVYVVDNEENMALCCLDESGNCVPGILTKFVLYKKSGDISNAKKAYRQLLEKSARFERELSLS
jgi:tetratricopeptide (TPR) repeat protein